jgi:Holliday junction resolvasome RuvABC endonuclease subunit
MKNMKRILGLDVSSATTGWCIIAYDDKTEHLIEYGHIKPPKSTKGSLAFRALSYSDTLKSFLKQKNPDFVALESYASRFPRGKSTARTIITLSLFNEVTSMGCLEAINMEPTSYAVSTIRSILSKMSKTKITSKEEAFEYICKYFEGFETRKNRAGNLAKECLDEADAIAVCLTYIYKDRNNG